MEREGIFTIDGFIKELQKFDLTSDQIAKALEAIRMIYAGQEIGYYGAILGHEFDENYKFEVEPILVRFGAIRTREVGGLKAYRCEEVGNRIGSRLWQKRAKDKEDALWSFLGNYPKTLVDFWFKYTASRTESQALACDFERYMPRDEVIVELLREPEVEEKIRSIWEGLVKIGLAVITIDNVSTRGGELRKPTFVLPPEVVKLIEKSDYGKIKIDFRECWICKVLIKYSESVNMSRTWFIEELRRHDLTEAEVKSVVEDLKRLNITSGYTDSPFAPFLIKNVELYREYLYKKYGQELQTLKYAILKISEKENEKEGALVKPEQEKKRKK